jgi:ABC-type glucose/galactose transport system permease subunit
MPTVEEVCMTFGLTDVDVEYTEADFQNLTTYKLFQQHVRPLLGKENPKVINILILCDILIVLWLFIEWFCTVSYTKNLYHIGSNVKAYDVGGSQVARLHQHQSKHRAGTRMRF